MNAQPAREDLALRLPLAGLHLVEASAGTGKTFALTAWMLRLLLECGVALPNLLAVTFTRAATAELRDRIRRRLRGAEALLAGKGARDDEQRQTQAIIDQAIAASDGETVHTRLSAALLQLDEAAVFTIHGFCQRALREFGFIAGSLGEEGVIDDPREAWATVAADLWRQANLGTREDAAHLRTLWKKPEELAKALPDVCDPARALLPVAGESGLAAWLHALREEACARFEAELARRGERSQDQLLGRMHEAMLEPRFAAAVGARWPKALVDEFQDTDPRQWTIFRRLYEAACKRTQAHDAADSNCIAPLLGLVGDPKQAIYAFRGGDLKTYLSAKREVGEHGSDEAPAISSLDVNYRSRPSVLAAIEALFAQNKDPFRGDIAFHHVDAARRDDEDALAIDGRPPPGLTVHWLPHSDNYRTSKPEAAAAIATTVREIAKLLGGGRLRTKEGIVPVRMADIAVLVHTNKQAEAVRDALADAGIAAAVQGRASVFASEAAGELQCLIEACAHPGDAARARAALATRLLGFDAAAIAALEDAADTHASTAMTTWQARFEAAALAWQQRGPLPALLPFLDGEYLDAGGAAARLAQAGGSRLLTDALHLAELLQARADASHGLNASRRWFARQCASPPQGDDLALRLDADADAVLVQTLHKAKGLEYPVVFLPFVAFERGQGPQPPLRHVRVQGESGPANYFYCKEGDRVVFGSDSRHDGFLSADEQEEDAEAQRLFYVGLTRARFAIHLTWGCNRSQDFNASPLAWLLNNGERAGSKKGQTRVLEMAAKARDALDRVVADSHGAIAVVDMVRVQDMPTVVLSPTIPKDEVGRQARIASALLPRGEGQYSFSGLRGQHREALPARGADDEAATVAPLDGGEAMLGGAEFGNVVHAVLETADFAAWEGAIDAPASSHDAIRRALAHRGLPQTSAAIAQVGVLVARALNVELPGTGTLARLPATRRVAEMEFHFRLAPTRLPALYALLERHGYPRHVAPAHSGSIAGLMHGYIDLLYRDDAGRHYVLDYKTNRLPAYDAAACRQAIADNDYDLQYLLYLVAVQRWLRLRCGTTYDPVRHLGGAVYLFLRGIDAEGNGVHAARPPQALIDAMDALFDGGAA